MWEKLTGRAQMELWLPTATLRFFEVLSACLPKHRVLLADFDELPSTVRGRMGPVVQSRGEGGSYVDYDTYTVPQGSCDIFFPTDFKVLAYMYKQTCGRDA